MSAVVADTHALLWYLNEPQHLSSIAVAALDAADACGGLHVSAISVVEVIYLVDKGRLPRASLTRLRSVLAGPVSSVVIVPVDLGVANAVEQIPRTVVPDMPDRIITATALHLGVPLVTRDAAIRQSAVTTIW